MSNDVLSRALFHAQTVALVGSSADPNKNTGRPQRFLVAHGFQGRIIPINPNRDEVQGLPAYPTLADAPSPIDHAFIMVPTQHVPGAIADCADAGLPLMSLLHN